jgi:hypothetical protein
MVNATVVGAFLNKSSSRTTKFDFVTISKRQLLRAKMSRHLRVNPTEASIGGYGSEDEHKTTVCPFNLIASFASGTSKSFFGRTAAKLGM